jgi:hypothetical protein
VAPELLVLQQHHQDKELQLQTLNITDPHHEDVDRTKFGENSSCRTHGAFRSANREYITSGRVSVVVFAGEFLQILSKGRFRAAVHRVRDVGATHK